MPPLQFPGFDHKLFAKPVHVTVAAFAVAATRRTQRYLGRARRHALAVSDNFERCVKDTLKCVAVYVRSLETTTIIRRPR